MKYKIPIPFTLIFWIIALVNVIAFAAHLPLLNFIAKPLLMPVLILWVTFNYNNLPRQRLLLTALFFSWIGDMLLLFEMRADIFFILGLSCFLIAHIFYTVYFLKIPTTNISLLKKQPWLIVVVIGYAIGLVWILLPHLGDLKIPVIVYATAISCMLLSCLHIFLKVNKPANNFYLLGAVVFVISDSLLALDKFYLPFASAGIFIMLSYCAAQFFIVTGFTKHLYND